MSESGFEYIANDKLTIPCSIMQRGFETDEEREFLLLLLREARGLVPRWVAELCLDLVEDEPDRPNGDRVAMSFSANLKYARLVISVHRHVMAEHRKTIRSILYHELIEAALFPTFIQLEDWEVNLVPLRMHHQQDDRDRLTQALVAAVLFKQEEARDATIAEIEKSKPPATKAKPKRKPRVAKSRKGR